MAFGKLNFSKFFGEEYDENEVDSDSEYVQDSAPETEMESAPQTHPGNKVVAMKNNAVHPSKIIIFEPRVYSDAKEVGGHLLNNKAVIVNFTRLDPEAARRIVDFLTGTIYAIHGDIKRVGDQIFLCTPTNFVIDGKITDIMDQDDIN